MNHSSGVSVIKYFLDDRLLVGTKQGHLLTYVIVKHFGEHKHDVQLLSYNKNFSKKPIQQLEVVSAYQLLISLSGVFISKLGKSFPFFPYFPSNLFLSNKS